MICLGVESTAHTFGVGICKDSGEILANCRDLYKPPLGWGIKPVEAAEHHRKIAEQVLKDALKTAGIKLDQIDILAYSRGPGLPPCLHVGKEFVAGLAKKTKKPIIGSNHCIAHIEIGRLTTKLKDPVTLYVSGANTQTIAFVGQKYRIFGETQDIGLGNGLDKFAREVGLEFPGGPKIEELAKKGKWIELPYVVKGMDLSYTGIITEAIKKAKTHKLEDVCFSLQETSFAMLTEVVERALAHTGKDEVLLTGGVAANSRLQEMLDIMCKERGGKFAVVPRGFSGDQAGMISWLGLLQHKSGDKGLKKPDINPSWRTDEVNVNWI